MGVESEERRTRPRSRIHRGTFPSYVDFPVSFFLDTFNNFTFFNNFEIKWPKFKEKIKFRGRWFLMVESAPTPVENSWRRPCLKMLKVHTYLLSIPTDSLDLLALNIDSLLANLIEAGQSNPSTLTWPVTLSMTSRSNCISFSEISGTGAFSCYGIRSGYFIL